MPSMTSEEYRAKYVMERNIQKPVCGWLAAQGILHYAVPNGQYRPGDLKEVGIQSGVPDLCIPVRGRVHNEAEGSFRECGSLYIELKRPGRYARKAQRRWLNDLTDAGHACAVCRSLEEVQDLYAAYTGKDGRRLTAKDLWPEQR